MHTAEVSGKEWSKKGITDNNSHPVGYTLFPFSFPATARRVSFVAFSPGSEPWAQSPSRSGCLAERPPPGMEPGHLCPASPRPARGEGCSKQGRGAPYLKYIRKGKASLKTATHADWGEQCTQLGAGLCKGRLSSVLLCAWTNKDK